MKKLMIFGCLTAATLFACTNTDKPKEPVSSDTMTVTEKIPEPITKDTSKVYDFVALDSQPSFPGGTHGFYEYLRTNLKYPPMAIKNNTEGKVYVSFVVETDGSLSDIKIDRKLGAGTDEEAVRVLKKSPKWIPGKYKGEVVRTKFNIPISFTLTDKKA
ncbi:energy transducer TonB [Pedobacter metabolipauper]|uniref:Protein TonB n=1 Tax=Pedobacter metabolipauper TaxID=425513 RepID=A0A4R6SVC0_9SPHI|nr:energy transducer TonB [Pedobacter metabolipauper]TDQ09286.1 protein TonB [Pedobacter metabolipauper]